MVPKPKPLNPYTPAAPPVYGGSPAAASSVSPFATDPAVALAQAQAQQGNTDLDAWLKAQQDRASLDQQTGLDRLAHNQQLDHMSIVNNLAARGLIRSGDLGYREKESAYQFGNQQQDLRQAILDKLAGYTQSYLQQKQALQAAVLQAMQGAYANAAANPPLPPVAPPVAPPPIAPPAGLGTPTVPLSQLTAKKLKQIGLRAR